jgi:hypothetical protein
MNCPVLPDQFCPWHSSSTVRLLLIERDMEIEGTWSFPDSLYLSPLLIRKCLIILSAYILTTVMNVTSHDAVKWDKRNIV